MENNTYMENDIPQSVGKLPFIKAKEPDFFKHVSENKI